jgi:hypothetical protein
MPQRQPEQEKGGGGVAHQDEPSIYLRHTAENQERQRKKIIQLESNIL